MTHKIDSKNVFDLKLSRMSLATHEPNCSVVDFVYDVKKTTDRVKI